MHYITLILKNTMVAVYIILFYSVAILGEGICNFFSEQSIF